MAALQNLALAGINGQTWFALSRYLLGSQPDKQQQVNDIYNTYLGTNINNAGGDGGNGETPAPNGDNNIEPSDTTPAPETTNGNGRRRFL